MKSFEIQHNGYKFVEHIETVVSFVTLVKEDIIRREIRFYENNDIKKRWVERFDGTWVESGSTHIWNPNGETITDITEAEVFEMLL